MTFNPGKFRRAEELVTPSQRRTMHWLMDNGYGLEAVMERFGLTEMAAKEYVSGRKVSHESKWQIRWDDSAGDSHTALFDTFKAAREYHAALRDVEWSKIERV